MKKLIFLSLLVTLITLRGYGQNAASDNGKTYYDAEKTKPKEVFSYKDVVRTNPNDPTSKQAFSHVKHGPYFYYYENGKIKISGEYHNDLKNGEWKYYDEKGTLVKTEKYKDDQLEK